MLAMLAVFGALFGVLGGAMAFVIVYTEYQRHGFNGPRLVDEALRVGIIAFLVFFLSATLIGFLAGRVYQPR
jgi:Na+/H+ antiporter NhaA